MSSARVLALLGLFIPLSACAIHAVPVSTLPGPNKTPAAFARDETACRMEAAKAAYPAGTPAPARPGAGGGNVNAVWQAFFTSFGHCEAARGNLVQPVPWAVAYQLYLGLGYPLPYPGAYAPVFASPYPLPYGYP